MLVKFILLIVCAVSLSGVAQVYDPVTAQKVGGLSFYSEAYIYHKRLRSFHASYSTKAELDIIRPSQQASYYEFNRSGQLVKEYSVRFGDTTYYSYEYDYKSRLLKMRIADAYGLHSYTYEYDNDGRMTQREYRLRKGKYDKVYGFDLNESEIQTVEVYEYIDFEGVGYKKNYLNSVGKVYREEIFYYNSERIGKKESKTINGSGRTKTVYNYNKEGLLDSTDTYVKLVNETTSSSKYEYDVDGNLIAVKEYKNGVYVVEKQIVYKSVSGLLSAIIKRQNDNNFMTIIQFTGHQYFAF